MGHPPTPAEAVLRAAGGAGTQNGEDNEGGQEGGEGIEASHQHGVAVAVAAARAVAGVSDDAAEAQSQREEDLRGCLPPGLACPPH